MIAENNLIVCDEARLESLLKRVLSLEEYREREEALKVVYAVERDQLEKRVARLEERAGRPVSRDKVRPDAGALPAEAASQNEVSAALPVLDLASVEKRHIQRVLDMTNGNKAEAARLLNIGLTTIYRKIEEYDLYYK
jgi:DNA-binding NtrC family response regulator